MKMIKTAKTSNEHCTEYKAKKITYNSPRANLDYTYIYL